MAALAYVDRELGTLRRRYYQSFRDGMRHQPKWAQRLRAQGSIEALDEARLILERAAEWSLPEHEVTKANGC